MGLCTEGHVPLSQCSFSVKPRGHVRGTLWDEDIWTYKPERKSEPAEAHVVLEGGKPVNSERLRRLLGRVLRDPDKQPCGHRGYQESNARAVLGFARMVTPWQALGMPGIPRSLLTVWGAHSDVAACN